MTNSETTQKIAFLNADSAKCDGCPVACKNYGMHHIALVALSELKINGVSDRRSSLETAVSKYASEKANCVRAKTGVVAGKKTSIFAMNQSGDNHNLGYPAKSEDLLKDILISKEKLDRLDVEFFNFILNSQYVNTEFTNLIKRILNKKTRK